MSKTRVLVTNNGKRIRDRLGSRFLPNETKEMEVNNRQYLTLKAVKDFTVEIIEDTQNTNINTDNDNNENDDFNDERNINNNDTEDETEEELDYYELNIEEVLKAVREGVFDVDEAIAYEVAGKNRVTLLDKLEDLKQGG